MERPPTTLHQEPTGGLQGRMLDPERMRMLRAYLAGSMDQVEGWLSPESAKIIAGISAHQVAQGWAGAVGEIGVHHGKLFIVLILASNSGEKAFAVDVFERQDLNVDQSGRGDRATFEANLRSVKVDPGAVTIFAKSSLELAGEDLRRAVGEVRLMSIDGGHTPAAVLNDLHIADVALAEHGVAVLDDVFNGGWPGVVTGFARYMAETPRLVPFAISPNKVYVCTPAFAAHYRSLLRGRLVAQYDRTAELFGHAVDAYWMS